MQPTPDFNAAKLARSLLRRSRQGALATLMAGSGDPYCSLVNVASYSDGSPILLISRLALHTRNILADSRVSLMLDERAEGDPLEGSRIMLAGRAGEAGADDLTPEQFLTDISDAGALLEAEQGALDHMNADHRDAMNLYATKLLGAEAADWCCTGCDPDGMDMRAGTTTLRLEFPRRIVTPAALRQTLKAIADQARAATST